MQEQTDHANFIQAARAHVAQCNAAAQRVIDEAHVEAVRIVAEPAAKAAVLEQKCDALRYEAQQLEAKVAATRRVLDDLRGALNPSTKGQPT